MNTLSLTYQRRGLKGGASQILFAGALVPGDAHQPKELKNPWSTQTCFVYPRVLQTHTSVDTLLRLTFPGIHAP